MMSLPLRTSTVSPAPATTRLMNVWSSPNLNRQCQMRRCKDSKRQPGYTDRQHDNHATMLNINMLACEKVCTAALDTA